MAAVTAPQHTAGMVALVPAAGDAAQLAVDGGLPVDELHTTLAFLGDDVTDWTPEQRDTVLTAVRAAAAGQAPLDCQVFGHAEFNPNAEDDHEPAAVYL